MRVETRSRIVRKALRAVLRKIPTADRRAIEGFVVRVWAKNYWVARFGVLKKGGAFVHPAFRAGERIDFNNILAAQIEFTLPYFRLYSEEARIGVVAHEFGHIMRAIALGPGWYRRIEEAGEVEDSRADDIARSWGFGPNIEAYLREMSEIDEAISACMPQIQRMIERREARWAAPPAWLQEGIVSSGKITTSNPHGEDL